MEKTQTWKEGWQTNLEALLYMDFAYFEVYFEPWKECNIVIL